MQNIQFRYSVILFTHGNRAVVRCFL